MNILRKESFILPLVMSAILLGACGHQDNQKEKNNAKAQEEQKQEKEHEKEKAEFKGAPNPSTKSDELLATVSPFFQRLVDNEYSVGTVVAVVTPDGVSVKGFGNLAAEKDLYNLNFQLASVTKVFTGMAFASMVNDGIVSLDTPIADCAPENLGLELPNITLGELTTHTAGLPMDAPSVRNGSPEFYTQTTAKKLWLDLARAEMTKPGKFSYSNYGAALLGSALANCDGEATWDKVVEKRVTGPLGISGINMGVEVAPGYNAWMNLEKPWDWVLPDSGAPAGFRGNVKNLSRLLQMMMSDEDFKGRDTILKSMEENHALGQYEQEDVPTNYVGFNWFIGVAPFFVSSYSADDDLEEKLAHAYFHTGGSNNHLSLIAVIPEEKVGLIVFQNYQFARIWEPLVISFADIFDLKDDVMEHTISTRLPEIMDIPQNLKDRLIGSYTLPDDPQDITISITDGDGRYLLVENFYEFPIPFWALDIAVDGEINFFSHWGIQFTAAIDLKTKKYKLNLEGEIFTKDSSSDE